MSIAPTTPSSGSAASTSSMPSMAALLTEDSDPVKPHHSKDVHPSSAPTPPVLRRVAGMNDILVQDTGA
jgi:hypothetical protein